MSYAKGDGYPGQARLVEPLADIYQIYTADQIRDIADGIEYGHEIPHHYNYLGDGAVMWDRYASGLAEDTTPNLVNDSSRLLDLSAAYVDELIGGDQKVNIVDLGPGNGYPMRSTLQRFINGGRLNRYIGIDVSPGVLATLRANIRTWFGDLIECETHVRNFSDQDFGDLLQTEAEDPVNLVFLLGGTLNNFPDPGQTIRRVLGSMSSRDLLFYSGYLDTEHMRHELRSSGKIDNERRPSDYLPYLLGLSSDLCDVELTYNDAEQVREKVLRPKTDLILAFDVDGEPRRVTLSAGEPILLLRRRHYVLNGIVDIFERNGFDLQQATKSADRNHVSLVLRPAEM